MRSSYNGDVTYEVCVGGSKTAITTVRSTITPKRVRITTRTWDRAGKQVSKCHVSQMPARLISYKLDGGE